MLDYLKLYKDRFIIIKPVIDGQSVQFLKHFRRRGHKDDTGSTFLQFIYTVNILVDVVPHIFDP